MDYFVLSGFGYWKYYIMLLYYRLAEYPPMVRFCAIFTTFFLISFVVLLFLDGVRTYRNTIHERHDRRARRRYQQAVVEMATTPQNLDPDVILERLDIPEDYKPRPRFVRPILQMLLDIYPKIKDNINKANWREILRAFRMQVYFERQVRSRDTRKRLNALMNISDIDAELKEAIATRYLFAKDAKLKIYARIHAARYGSSYPFKVIEEDPSFRFSEEMMVRYHNVFLYRVKNRLSMPNLVQWCNLNPVNEELRIFAVNEIRLLKMDKSCPELLQLLRDTRDERFACALIKALGELKYIPAEHEFFHRYASASFAERAALVEAFGNIQSDRQDVVDFLVEDYRQTTDAVTRMKLLSTLYDYGIRGRIAYEDLKASSEKEYEIFFQHIECPLIDNKKYA